MKAMKNLSFSIATLVLSSTLISFFVGCNYRVNKEGATEPTNGSLSGSLDWTTISASSIEKRCANCHREYRNDANGYANVVADLAAIKEVVVSKRMPKDGPLTADQESLLLAWIDAGAPETADDSTTPKPQPPPVEVPTPTPVPPPNESPTPTPVPVPTPTPVPNPPPTPENQTTFTWIKKNIFEAPTHQCLDCHVEFGRAEDYPLDELSKILATPGMIDQAQPDKSLLIEAVTRTQRPMPPRRPGYSPLTQEEVDILREWIRQGAPE